MKNPIFVSYSRKDKEIVFPLVQNLESELKVKCWIDRDGIHSGDEFRDKIIQAIDNSEVVLFPLILRKKSIMQRIQTKRLFLLLLMVEN